MLCSDEISLGHLAEVERYSVKDIVTFFEIAAGAAHQRHDTESSLQQEGGKAIKITSEMLDALRETRARYLNKLKILQTFTQHFGTKIRAIDADTVLRYLEARQEAMVTLTLRQATLPDHWDPFTDDVLPAAEESNHLVDAQTFENVLVPYAEQFNLRFPAVKKEAFVIPSLVRAASEVVRPTVSEYAKECRAYANWQQLRLSDVQQLWANVNVDQIKHELALIRRTVDIGPTDEDLVDTLTCLIELNDRTRKLEQIVKVVDLFQPKTEASTVIQHAVGGMGSKTNAPTKTKIDTEVVQEPSLKSSSTDFSQQQQLHANKDELIEWINGALEMYGTDVKHNLTLKDLHSFAKIFFKISSTMKPDSWRLLHEYEFDQNLLFIFVNGKFSLLQGANNLVAFLKSVEHEDLSNWINAVEDQSDSQ
ncbi:hypothetical protein BC937DRAFT_86288 [Endogone sp. FLAS-F59071]|nr:hypothetical protein BC937DRAFT_86288 [Endogone sp. FLAS-F59071]|eukprot:RUS20140.1 hypothetical protein BC937DRAFT_86288 [Endogone sp. FLAS-F59071]